MIPAGTNMRLGAMSSSDVGKWMADEGITRSAAEQLEGVDGKTLEEMLVQDWETNKSLLKLNPFQQRAFQKKLNDLAEKGYTAKAVAAGPRVEHTTVMNVRGDNNQTVLVERGDNTPTRSLSAPVLGTGKRKKKATPTSPLAAQDANSQLDNRMERTTWGF